MSKIKVTLVDDHVLFRNGLKILLDASKDIKVICEANDGQEFLDSLKKNIPDIVLMDISMPKVDGIEATHRAIEKYPNLKIVALSMFNEGEYYYKMINAGVKGFILKESDIDEVKDAIYQVMEGESFFSQKLLYNVIQNFSTQKEIEIETANLSARELQVLQEICKGLSNQEIADELFISKRTVDKHRANLLSKTDSKNTANLIMYAIKNKLIAI